MKQSSAFIHKSFIAFVFIGLIIFPAFAQEEDLNINNNTLITDVDPPREVNNVVYNNNSKLTIDGTLIVNGDFNMDKNGASLELGEEARLIVFGDFIGPNQVLITLKKDSYLFVYGNFFKGGSSKQDVLVIDTAKIYILGQESNWGENFSSCEGNYEGSTKSINEKCDFGKEKDLENNQDQFPDDLLEQLNCYNISAIQDQDICTSQSATFSVDPISGVSYQWQVKPTSATTWTDIKTNSNSPSLIIPNVSQSMDGNIYRVVVKPTNTGSACKISISKPAVLTVTDTDFNIGSITGPANVCTESSEITYSIPQVENSTYSWNFPAGWTVINGKDSNSINVRIEEYALSGTIDITVSNQCKTEQASLFVSVNSKGKWTGIADTNWNNPANWSCNSVPTLQTDVLIPAGVSRYPVISDGDNALAKDLEIETGASILVSDNWLRVAGNFTNSGNLNASAGSISFEGSFHQIIPANAWDNGTIHNLNIENPEGVSSQGRIEVLNSLKVEKGIFETGSDLVLVSSESGTAFIDGSGNGHISGTVTMQRYLSNAYGYKYFSSPFKNTTVGDFGAFMDLVDPETGFHNLYEYIEERKDTLENDLSGWQAYVNSNAGLFPGKGYALNFSNETAPITVELSGEITTEPVTLNLQNTDGEFTRGFHLVGNPYASPIKWSEVTHSGINNAVYFFNSGSEDRYTGTYTSYVNGITTGGSFSDVIPSMQGFFVQVSEAGAPGTLTFTNSARTGNEVPQEFYKTRNTSKPLIKLTAGFVDEKISDATVIYFASEATDKFESTLDAQKILNTAIEVPNLYSLTRSLEKLAINAISRSASETIEIPLGLRAERTGEMIFELSEVRDIFPSLHIYLKDHKNKILTDLNEKLTYSFTSQKGENNDRFVLMLSSEKLSAEELVRSAEDFNVMSKKGEILVALNLQESNSGRLVLSNISGQVLQQRKVAGKEEVKFSGNLISGVYLVTLETGKSRQTKKVILKK